MRHLLLVAVVVLALTLPCGVARAGEASALVRIVAPEAGCTATVGDELAVLVFVSQDLDVSSLAVMCDSRGVGMTDVSPYTVTWDTSDFQPGDHALRAFAYLKSGERVGAEPVSVTLYAPVLPNVQTLPVAEALPSVKPVTLKEGTPVLLATTEKMVSGRVAEGSTVRYKVLRDVGGPDGNIVIPYGGFAQGRVTRSRRRGMFGKAGQLEFTVDSVEAVDGTTVPLRAFQEAAGKGNKNAVIVSTILLSVLAVFLHGRDVDVPEATEITAYVDHDTPVARPQAPGAEGVIRGEPLEVVAISEPSNGSVFRRGAEVRIALDVEPAEKFRSVRIFADDAEILSHEGELKDFGWSTGRVPTKEYSLSAEVRFTNGRVLRSAPVTVTVTEQ